MARRTYTERVILSAKDRSTKKFSRAASRYGMCYGRDCVASAEWLNLIRAISWSAHVQNSCKLLVFFFQI